MERGGKARKIGWARDAVLLLGAVGALTLTLSLYARFGFATLSGIANGEMVDTHLDFTIFRQSALAWLEGANPFRDTGAPDISNNPPIWTVLFSPFALLEPITAYRLWVPLMAIAQTIALALAAEELRMRDGAAVLAVATLLVSAPLLGTLTIGQMYPVLALGLAAAWACDRKGKPVASGVALGLTVAIKPSLAPVLLWPLVRKRLRSFVVALATGALATVAGVLVVGFGPTLDWLDTLRTKFLDGAWDNASLPGAAALMFRENRFAEPLATPPYAVAAALILGLGLVAVTAYRARRDPETGLWALAAAALLASPVTWHNYLPVLAPGVLVLLARRRTAAAASLLIALGLVPQSWTALWEGRDTAVATLALGLYSYVLLAHWLAFFYASGGPTAESRPADEKKNPEAEEIDSPR
jgi:hypothetical protein